MMHAQNTATDINRLRLVDSKEAASLVNLNRDHWLEMVRFGRAPSPIRIGERKLAWKLGDLLDFIDARQLKAAA